MAYLSATSTIQGLLRQSTEKTPNNDYWNIDDILSEQELIPCSFKITATSLGYMNELEANKKQKEAKAQGKLTLPH
jgi:hypothetical protein